MLVYESALLLLNLMTSHHLLAEGVALNAFKMLPTHSTRLEIKKAAYQMEVFIHFSLEILFVADIEHYFSPALLKVCREMHPKVHAACSCICFPLLRCQICSRKFRTAFFANSAVKETISK